MAEVLLKPEAYEIPEPNISHIITEDDEPLGNIIGSLTSHKD